MKANDFIRENTHLTNEEMLVKFAAMHVEKALQVASEIDFNNVSYEDTANDYEEARSMAIINSYPLNNIK